MVSWQNPIKPCQRDANMGGLNKAPKKIPSCYLQK